MGDIVGCSARGYPSFSGEGAAAWRRREGARCRETYFGEGRGGRGGLEDGDGLYVGRSYAGAGVESICRFAGYLDLPDPKPFLAAGRAYGFSGCGDAGGVNSLLWGRYGRYCGFNDAVDSEVELVSPSRDALGVPARGAGSSIINRAVQNV